MITNLELGALVAVAGGGVILLTRNNMAPSAPGPGVSAPKRVATVTRKVTAATPAQRAAAAAEARVRATSAGSGARDHRTVKAATSEKMGNGGNPNGLDKEVEDLILQRMKKEWEKAQGAAKEAICQRLKEAYPSAQGVDCAKMASAGFQQLLTVAATAVATAYCGPACGAVAALVTAWAGPKLEEWASDAWEGIKDVGEAIGSGLKDVGSKIDDVLPWHW